MGITHFDEARSRENHLGHLHATWTFLGEAAECVGIGVRRLQVVDGAWTTPAHEHGREEEIFYVLAGRGLSWHDGKVCEIGPGDCILYWPNSGAHTLHGLDGLDVLAFGPRIWDETVGFPRQGFSLLGRRGVETVDGVKDGFPVQFVREVEIGPPEIPEELDPRPPTVVNVAEVEQQRVDRPRVSRVRRNLGKATGSETTGLQHVSVAPGMESAPLHCHSLEEELFVMLEGDGVLVLDDKEETPVRVGSVVSRPPATGVSHLFRAGDGGLTYLAYGTREPGDICYYPRSNKINFGGVGVIGRLEKLDYWDGED